MSRVIDLGWAPITYIEVVGARTDEEVASDFAQLQVSLERHQRERRRVVRILDLRRATPMDARQRQQHVDWMRATEELQRAVTVGVVSVVSSPLIRGVLTALLWLYRPALPMDIVGSLDEAVSWAIEHCELERIAIPERLRTERAAVFETR